MYIHRYAYLSLSLAIYIYITSNHNTEMVLLPYFGGLLGPAPGFLVRLLGLMVLNGFDFLV